MCSLQISLYVKFVSVSVVGRSSLCLSIRSSSFSFDRLSHSLMILGCTLAQDESASKYPPIYTFFSNMVAEPFRSMAAAEMAEYVQRVGEQPSELPVEEWNLLPLINKNAVDSRR